MRRASGAKPRDRECVFLALGGLGDLLLLTPLIRQIARTGPRGRVVCVCPPHAKELFERNPHIDRLVVCPGPEIWYWALPQAGREVFAPFHKVELARAPGGDIRIVAREGLNPARGRGPAAEQIAAHFGVALADARPEIYTTRADRAAADRVMARCGGKPGVLLGFESTWPQKRLPVEIRRETRRRLRRRGCALLEVTGRRLRIGSVLLPLPGIRTMAEVARRCAAILTVDSFLGHLAAAVQKPAVVLFGLADPAVYGHPGNCNLHSGACRPCGGTPRRKRCAAAVCMSGFSAEAIAAAVLNLPGLRRRG